MKPLKKSLSLLFVLTALAACGNKGALYLPTDEAAPPGASEAPEIEDPEDSEDGA